MYAALFMRRLAELRHHAWQTAVKRSGLLIVIGVTVILLTIAVGLKERGRGHLSQLKTQLGVNTPSVSTPAVTIRPGGQDPVVLEHALLTHLNQPEFLSAILLPGRGMNVLQIKAYIPQKGEMNLLASPPLEDAARLLNGTGDDAHGAASLTMGGAIEVPWAGRMGGTLSPDGSILTATWQGHSLHLPVDFQKSNRTPQAASLGGLLLKRRADSVRTSVLPDGGQVQTIYDAGGFDGHWISHTEVTTTVQLSGRSMDMSISARNTGTVAEPIGIGWHPRFAILSGDRRQAMLKLPSSLHVEAAEHKNEMSTGKLSPVEGTPYDFTGREGARLGLTALNDTFVHLKPAALDDGPVVELRDPKSNYGLRITMMSLAIKALKINAPENESLVSIDPQFNYDDPFGPEWPKGEDTGMVVLQPGQTVQWKIRLEIFSLTGYQGPPI